MIGFSTPSSQPKQRQRKYTKMRNYMYITAQPMYTHELYDDGCHATKEESLSKFFPFILESLKQVILRFTCNWFFSGNRHLFTPWLFWLCYICDVRSIRGLVQHVWNNAVYTIKYSPSLYYTQTRPRKKRKKPTLISTFA